MEDENPYQPPLLSLQDMLNLSDDDDDVWSRNPYSISHFFEPISPTKSAKASTSGSGIPAQGTSRSLGAFESNQYDPFSTPTKQKSSGSSFSPQKAGGSNSGSHIKGEDEQIYQVEDDDDFLECLDGEMFEENVVNAEIQSSVDAGEEVICAEVLPRKSRASLRTRLASRVPDSDVEVEEILRTSLHAPLVSPIKEMNRPKIHLREVTVDDANNAKPDPNHKKREQIRKVAINELGSLINTLKRFSSTLGIFLANEGDLVVEHYHAQTMLSGLLPEMSETSPTSPDNPYELAHTITTALISHVRGRTALSALPPRRAHLWRTSELLLLQKAVLESAISRKEFLLNCRYTELLTDMGFDSEDLERLKRNTSKEAELGTMKIIMNEHNFFRNMKFSQKKPIQNVVLREDESGVPKVVMLPSPEQLVQDKWLGVKRISKEMTLSTLKDEDIDWLFVLKKLWVKNPRLNVTEEVCKLTYDHLISFKFNKAPWQVNELRKLQDIRSRFRNVPWSKIAQLLGTNRTPFSCFIKYKTYCESDTFKLKTSKSTLRSISSYFEQCKGNVARLDYELMRNLPRSCNYRGMKPKNLLALFHTTLNSRYRKGMFTIVEDVLLLVAMEKYRTILIENSGTLDPIGYALPWRSSTTWRMRFALHLTSFYSKNWTIEEDKQLWNLVEEYGPNYKIIQRSFPHKDRKQCRQRYTLLCEVFKTTNLETYHALTLFRKGGLRLEKLDEVAKYLDMTIKSKRCGNTKYVREIDLEFLRLHRAPREKELESYLMSFPVTVMISALARLADCLIHILEKWKEGAPQGETSHVEKDLPKNSLVGFDRRRFDPSCPISVASALHVRNAKLLPQAVHQNLTPFEENVYNYHRYFSIRCRAKRNSKRNGIPSLALLRKLSCVSRLIEQPTVVTAEGCPSVIMQMKMGPINTPEEEAATLQEIADMKKGARRKGYKRKKTQYKELKVKAAMARWGKKKEVDNMTIDDFYGSSHDNSPWSTFDSDPSYPNTPATPSSMASLTTGDGTDTETDSVSGYETALKKATVGLITDHAYILPMENPSNLATLTLPTLLGKLGHQHIYMAYQRLQELKHLEEEAVTVKVELDNEDEG